MRLSFQRIATGEKDENNVSKTGSSECDCNTKEKYPELTGVKVIYATQTGNSKVSNGAPLLPHFNYFILSLDMVYKATMLCLSKNKLILHNFHHNQQFNALSISDICRKAHQRS